MRKGLVIAFVGAAAYGCQDPGISIRSATTLMPAPSAASTQGPIVLRLAIDGAGYFSVSHAGATAYTRCGTIDLQSSGELAIHGDTLMPPVTLPLGSTNIAVHSNGQVMAQIQGATESIPLGQVDTFLFQHPDGLTPLGNGLYQNAPAAGTAPVEVPPGSKADGAGSLVATDSTC